MKTRAGKLLTKAKGEPEDVFTDDTLKAMVAEGLGTPPPEAGISKKIASLVGELMRHQDERVREIAAEILRHVERLETGR